MKYRVHRLDVDLKKDQMKLEQFLNNLDGEVVAIVPDVNPKFTAGGMGAKVDFLLIIEKIQPKKPSLMIPRALSNEDNVRC